MRRIGIAITNEHGSNYFDLHKPLPMPGDKFVFESTFMLTNDGETYHKGDTFLVIGRTDRTAYGARSSQGNLLIKGKNKKIVVWANVEYLLEIGSIQRVG